MKRVLLLLAAGTLVANPARAGLFDRNEGPSLAGKVVVLKVGEEDLMGEQSFRYMRRMVEKVAKDKAAALVIELDTPGGVAWETTDLMMNELAKLEVPTYAYVNSRAISAGALLALSMQTIYMAPAANIGAAGVVTFGQEMGKVERAKAEGMVVSAAVSVANLRGHDPDLVEAMIRMEAEFRKGPVKDDKRTLVTLTTQQATTLVDGKPLLAKGVAKDLPDLLRQEGISAAVVTPAPSGFEQFAWWIAKLSPLLILIGLGAGYFEMKTPGFGLGGTIALLAFGLFFFGNSVAGNLAGYELAALFLLGVVLIVLELLVLPGTMLPGIVGVLLVGVSLLLAMVDEGAFRALRETDHALPVVLRALSWPAVSLSLGILGGVAVILLLMRFLPDAPLFRSLVLQQASTGGAGIPPSAPAAASLPGASGVALTDLRPAGKAEIAGKTVDVTCDGFLPAGTRLEVVEQSAFRIVVRKAG